MGREKELRHSQDGRSYPPPAGTCCLPEDDWCEDCRANYRAWRDWLAAQRLRRRTHYLMVRSSAYRAP
jgi:hypothetical protein